MGCPRPSVALWRLPFLAAGIASLVAGVLGGLARLGVAVPLPPAGAGWVAGHGFLMVGFFLGTVIGLERAVGLPGRWAYLAPVLTASGAVLVVTGISPSAGQLLLAAGSVVFVAVTARIVSMRRELFTVTLCGASLSWAGGNAVALLGPAAAPLTPWWMGFLGLTIVGERIDLSRFQRPVPWAPPLLVAAMLAVGAGVLATCVAPAAGTRLAGAGWLAVAAWLGRFDLARRTLAQPGLPRFMSVSLLGGFAWMAVAGLVLLVHAPVAAGLHHDAAAHAFFLGFVFMMIFAHAPIIFPSVIGRPVVFRPRFYAHVGVLHASLALRVAADCTGWNAGRSWAGIGNAAALALFLANTVGALLCAGRPAGRVPARAAQPA